MLISRSTKTDRNQLLYILEAAVEYFISLLIADAFLATLLTRSGVSDATTGIITQLASFAFVAQLFSVFVRRTNGMKRFVTVLMLINQLLFVSLYFVPLVSIPQSVKAICFVVLFLSGHAITNVAVPYRTTWMMSFVPNHTRGQFTANKEIVSLLSGMIFSFAMGTLVDHMRAIGQESMGFILCGVTILILAISHFVILMMADDIAPMADSTSRHSLPDTIKRTLTNKTLLKLLLIDVGWHCVTGISVSFYGTYKINELGFSLQFVSILIIMYSISRVAVSRFFGRYADKHSWTRLLILCFSIAAIAFFVNIFTSPVNGKYLFPIYYCIYAIAMGGINSGVMNILFDFVPTEERPAALGIKAAAGGAAGLVASLIGSSILAQIQANGNQLFGMPVYAQQVLTAIAFVLLLLLVVYVKTVIGKLKALD